MVALAKFESEAEKYLERVILLAPCFGYSASGESKSDPAGYIKNELAKVDVFATGTSTWQADYSRICDQLTSDVC